MADSGISDLPKKISEVNPVSKETIKTYTDKLKNVERIIPGITIDDVIKKSKTIAKTILKAKKIDGTPYANTTRKSMFTALYYISNVDHYSACISGLSDIIDDEIDNRPAEESKLVLQRDVYKQQIIDEGVEIHEYFDK